MILSLIAAVASSAPSGIVVDLHQQAPISPYIYGANAPYIFGKNDPEWVDCGVPFTLMRLGGNRLSAYNWVNNASNAGNDWHNQSDNFMGESDEPAWTVMRFLRPVQQRGMAAIVTVPTMGYVSADKKGDGDVGNTPDYIHTRFKISLPEKPSPLSLNPDPNGPVYEDEFVNFVEKKKTSGTPVWFMLDNEPDLWSGTHSRVWTRKPTYAEILENNIEYASAIKRVAPKTLVFGPANYGWQGFHTFQDAPDGAGRDFLDFYLAGMKSAEERAGHRLLDVLDVHWYPEAKGGGVRVTEGSSDPAVAGARIQAPRSLWDPTYVEDSWITQFATKGRPLVLLPTIEGQIARHYPGTKFSVSEYNYGGNTTISGAIAEADVLGIFGRYGLFAACNWGIGPKDTGEVAGFRAFMDYDGQGGRFGNLGLAVSGADPASESIYAALDGKHPREMSLVVINKTQSERTMRINLKDFRARDAAGYSITADSLERSRRIDVQASGSELGLTAPPLSIETIRVRS